MSKPKKPFETFNLHLEMTPADRELLELIQNCTFARSKGEVVAEALLHYAKLLQTSVSKDLLMRDRLTGETEQLVIVKRWHPEQEKKARKK